MRPCTPRPPVAPHTTPHDRRSGQKVGARANTATFSIRRPHDYLAYRVGVPLTHTVIGAECGRCPDRWLEIRSQCSAVASWRPRKSFLRQRTSECEGERGPEPGLGSNQALRRPPARSAAAAAACDEQRPGGCSREQCVAGGPDAARLHQDGGTWRVLPARSELPVGRRGDRAGLRLPAAGPAQQLPGRAARAPASTHPARHGAVAAIPIWWRGDVIGANVLFSGRPHRFSTAEVDGLEMLTQLAAPGIVRAAAGDPSLTNLIRKRQPEQQVPSCGRRRSRWKPSRRMLRWQLRSCRQLRGVTSCRQGPPWSGPDAVHPTGAGRAAPARHRGH